MIGYITGTVHVALPASYPAGFFRISLFSEESGPKRESLVSDKPRSFLKESSQMSLVTMNERE